MKTTTVNNFQELNQLRELYPLHILTSTEGWETLFPETTVNLDKLLDLPLPREYKDLYYPYSMHRYLTRDQLLQDIEHNIQITDFTDLGGDDDFYDYIPNRLHCIIRGFKLLHLHYPDKIKSLASNLITRLTDAEDQQDFDYGIEYIDTFIPQLEILTL